MTTADSSVRASLLHLLSRISFKLGDFTLSAGGKSDFYIDCRITTLHAEGARLAGLAMLDEVAKHSLRPAAVGGLTLGADPLVSAISIASAQRAHQNSAQSLIHGYIVRKTEKAHGTGRRIEGFFEEGAPVLVVDDVYTTGKSILEAIQVTKASGMRVIGAACLVERANNHAAIEDALEGAPFFSIFKVDEVRAAHTAQLPL